MRSLLDYSWPGNIPELQNVLERAIVMTPGRVIEKVDLPEVTRKAQPTAPSATTLSRWLDEKEKQFFIQKLEDCSGNVALTARSWGIALRSLNRKMQKYGLEKRRFRRKFADADEAFTSKPDGLASAGNPPQTPRLRCLVFHPAGPSPE
jgi:two-component system nitrogen regulation response regulator NtrX